MFSLFTHPLETLTLLEPPPGFHKGGGNHVCAFTSPPLVTPTRPVPFKAGAASAYRRVGATDNMVLDIDVSGIIVSVGTALASLPMKEFICRTGECQARTKGQEQLLKLPAGTVLRRKRT